MDPILETILTFVQTIMANPVAAGAIYGVIRNVTGYLQKKYKKETGLDYDPKLLGADILKYEVAINSIFATLPPETAGKVAPLVIIADIVFSAAKKLKGTTIPSIVPSVETSTIPTPIIPPIVEVPQTIPPIAVPFEPVITYGSWTPCEDATGKSMWVRAIYTNGVKLKGMQGWQYSTTNPAVVVTPP